MVSRYLGDLDESFDDTVDPIWLAVLVGFLVGAVFFLAVGFILGRLL